MDLCSENRLKTLKMGEKSQKKGAKIVEKKNNKK